MTKSDLKKFFSQRPALSPSTFGEEAGYAEGRYLRQCMEEKASEELPPRLEKAITPFLKKYGYVGNYIAVSTKQELPLYIGS